ncbi:MAG: sigma-54 dependent transcriptional regulator [Holosporales bacterium]|jgi:two-component system nitrogen regulation response regulator NtrX|nr:sigma-54 dependent transcriptional regulator [Holosporales bacterium]
MSGDILIVDDEMDICTLVGGILSDEGYSVRTAQNSVQALKAIVSRQPNLVILDVWLGDGAKDGLKILEIIKRDHPFVPVVMMSGHGTVDTAVTAIKLGAYDFIEKPFPMEKLLVTVARALESAKLKVENVELKRKAHLSCSLIGSSMGVQLAKQTIDASAPTSVRIFIHGPIGSDRNAVARYVHEHSLVDGPFYSINCSTINQSHLAAELFGLETISRDDDTPRKIGLLEQANGGTLFIDNMTSLSDVQQIKLAKFLQTKSFYREGGSSRICVEVRVLGGACFSKEEILGLSEDAEEGDGAALPKIRPDLYYRLSSAAVEIPPLSERAQDMALLVKHFSAAITAAQNLPAKIFSTEVISVLEGYPWPGDIQQLKNVIEWILIMHASSEDGVITVEDLPPEIVEGNLFVKAWQAKSAQLSAMPIKEARETFERDYLLAQLKRFNGNISQTAKFIGMDRTSLHRKLKCLGVVCDDSGDDSTNTQTFGDGVKAEEACKEV